MRLAAITLCMLAACGCSGRYVLTVPDHVAPAGGEATAAMRLQRVEFGRHNPPVRDAAVRFQVESNPLRAAYTDKAGYAVANVPVGNEVGKAVLAVLIMDKNGREAEAYSPIYVLDPTITIVAVELDAVLEGPQAAVGKAALNDAAGHSYIVYFTRQGVDHHAGLHRDLDRESLPDGPILQWQRHNWVLRRMWTHLPYYAFSPHMVSSLEGLRKQLPGLRFGLCNSDAAAAAFAQAGLKVARIGSKTSFAPQGPRAATKPATQPTTASQPATTTSPASKPESMTAQ